MSNMKQWLEMYGWINYKNSVREGMCFYGSYDDYIFNLIQKKGHKEVKTVLNNVSKEHQDNIIKNLNSNKRKYRISLVTITDNILNITLKETFSPVPIETIEKMLRSITDYLYKIDIHDKNYCSDCGTYGAQDYAEYKGIITPLCHSCYHSLQQQQQDQIVEQQEKTKEAAVTHEKEISTSYLKGIIGAVVGGVLGVIALFFADRFMNVFFSYILRNSTNSYYEGSIPRWFMTLQYTYHYAINALIGLGIFIGYKLLRGKMEKAAPWIMIGIATFFMMASRVFMVAWYYGRYRSGGGSLFNKMVLVVVQDQLLEMMIYGPYARLFWRHMAISLGISAIVILIGYGLSKGILRRVFQKNRRMSA
jgi:hypothetical protein